MAHCKVNIADCLSVHSIMSVWHVNLANITGGNEEHDFPEIFYVEKGQHTTLLDDVPYEISEGQVIIYAPHAFHRGLPGVKGTATVGIICFASDFCDLCAICNRVITLTANQRTMIEELIKEGCEMFEFVKHPDYEKRGLFIRSGVSPREVHLFKYKLELFLTDVFGVNAIAAKSRTGYRKEQFDKTVMYLKANLCTPLSLDGIAAEFQMSNSTLSALFKDQCGIGPITYLNKLRISEAQRLIRETNLTFTEIAERVGFSSIHYFSRMFKNVSGMTPTAYAESSKINNGMEP